MKEYPGIEQLGKLKISFVIEVYTHSNDKNIAHVFGALFTVACVINLNRYSLVVAHEIMPAKWRMWKLPRLEQNVNYSKH